MKHAVFIRKLKIPQKYLPKLRKRYHKFILVEFEEYNFVKAYVTTSAWGKMTFIHTNINLDQFLEMEYFLSKMKITING